MFIRGCQPLYRVRARAKQSIAAVRLPHARRQITKPHLRIATLTSLNTYLLIIFHFQLSLSLNLFLLQILFSFSNALFADVLNTLHQSRPGYIIELKERYC